MDLETVERLSGLQLETSTPTTPLHDTEHTMLALEAFGNKDVRVVRRARPKITDPQDAIVKITLSTICGSDLHLYHKAIPEVKKGDVLGHEGVGIIEEVGPGIHHLKKGTRVAVSAIIADGTCWFCRHEQYSHCDTTNKSGLMEKMYGHKTAGIFGYSHLVGGYEGMQAEYVRVPYAEVNCLPLPDEVSDEQAIFLSDVMCTAWQACENGDISGADAKNEVAIWGLGPIGMMSLALSLHRGAQKVLVIDNIPARLDFALQKFPTKNVEICNFDTQNPLEEVRRVFGEKGPDAVIDATGFRYTKNWSTAIEMGLYLETDSIDALTEAIKAVRKGGNVSIIGDYIGYTNHFPIGAVMELGLTTRSGQVHVQKWWRHLLELIRSGKFDPSFQVTHRFPLEKAAEAYRMFDRKEDGCIKVLLLPPATRERVEVAKEE